MKIAMTDTFLKQIQSTQKHYGDLIKTYHFSLKEKNQKIEDKEKYAIHIRDLKQALNHRLILKDVHRVIKFNQEAWLKPYIDMNTKLRTEAKINSTKIFSS